MPKKRGGGRRPIHRQATRRPPAAGTRHHDGPGPSFDPEAQPLVRSLRAALRAPEPTAFLVTGAAVAAAALTSSPPADPGNASLLESFVEVPIAETTAVLHVVAALTTDDLQRARLDRVLAGRRHPVPATVRHLREVRVEDTWFMGDDLGDGDNVIVGLRWPGGEAVTAVAYIDHNLGTVVKDAFFVDAPIAEVVERYTELVAEAGGHRGNAPVRMAPAEARARIEQAIADTDFLLVGDPDGEWPLCAPLLEFVVERMPAGGSGYADRPGFDPVEAAAVTALPGVGARAWPRRRRARGGGGAVPVGRV